MGEDELHSGDGSVDLFTEEELLPLSAPSFRTVTGALPVSAKPKSPTPDSTTPPSMSRPKLEESDTSPVKIKMLNNSRLALTEILPSLTTPSTPQTLPGIGGIGQKEGASHMNILNMELTSSLIKMKSNSASSEMTRNILPSTVPAVNSQPEVTMTTLTGQSHYTGPISRENISQVNKQNTLSSVTPLPRTKNTTQVIIVPEINSTTITDEGSHMKTNAGMTATTTDSGNTEETITLTTPNVTEGKSNSTTTASMGRNRLVYSTTTTITTSRHDKPNPHSIRLPAKQNPKRKIFKTVGNEGVKQKPQRQPGE